MADHPALGLVHHGHVGECAGETERSAHCRRRPRPLVVFLWRQAYPHPQHRCGGRIGDTVQNRLRRSGVVQSVPCFHLFPHTHGHLGLAKRDNSPLREEYRDQTLPVLMKAAGYRTGIIGKLRVNPKNALPFDFNRNSDLGPNGRSRNPRHGGRRESSSPTIPRRGHSGTQGDGASARSAGVGALRS